MPSLTIRTAEAAKPNPDRDYTVWDDEIAGFGLRIWPSGRKVWVFQYRERDTRKVRKMTYGTFPSVKPEKAREQARADYAAVTVKGQSPMAELKARRDAETVDDLAKIFADYISDRKRLQPIKNDLRMLARFVVTRRSVLPLEKYQIEPEKLDIAPGHKLGQMKIDQVQRSDIEKLIEKLRDHPYQANRVVALLSKMFNIAEKKRLRPDGTNPCRHIEKFHEEKRRRLITNDELARLGAAMEFVERQGDVLKNACDAIRLLMLTGMRHKEARNLQWGQVQLDEGRIVVPIEKAKNREAQLIPLNSLAQALLAQRTRDPENGFVFPGARAGKPLYTLQPVWEHVRNKAGILDLRLHDLRHHFGTIAAGQSLGLPIIGRLLSHKSLQATARYAHVVDEVTIAASERISATISAQLTGAPSAAIVPIKRKRKGR